MFKQTLQRGFTLIELLVVIAIIGILAAVVLTSLSGAQEGAQNSNVKQTLGSVRSGAQLVYNENNFSYATVCSSGSEVVNTLDDLAASLAFIDDVRTNDNNQLDENIQCNSNDTAYAVTAPLFLDGTAGASHWCVDSSGNQSSTTDALAPSTYQCP